MAYGDFKNLLRRAASDKLLRDKAFDIAINLNYYWYQRDIASMAYNLFDKKSATGSGTKYKIENEIKRNKQNK